MSDDANTNQSPTEDQPEVDPRFADDPLTKDGKPRTRRKPLTKEEQEKLTEEIRMSLILDVNEGDIKRDVFKRWNLRPKRTQKYITRARRRNASSLAESPEDALASSIGYWGRLKRNAEARLQREEKIEGWANAALDRCEKDADALRERATKETPFTEQFEAIEMRRSNAIALREQARRAQFAASTSSKEAQREIDRLKGNIIHRVARTDTKGKDIPEFTEPTTPAAVDNEIKSLVEQLRNRQTGVPAIPGPSSN